MLNLTNLQTKGYDELIEIDGEIVYQVFAIKKNNGTYSTYYYTVPKSKLDQAEDYEIDIFNQKELIYQDLIYLKVTSLFKTFLDHRLGRAPTKHQGRLKSILRRPSL